MPPSGSSTSAVILAAGTSSRMGALKQLLRLDGRPLLQHVLENVRASEAREIVVVLGASAEVIRGGVDLHDVRVVMNENFQQGMGTSLKAGVAALAADADSALIILADQPFVRSSTLNSLIAEHRKSKAEIVIPTYRGFRGNPVLLDRSVFPEVMQLGGDIGCRAIFGDHPQGIVKLPVEDIGILLDIDRRGDLEALRSIGDRAGREQALLDRTELKDRQVSAGAPLPPELVIVGRDGLALALAKLARVLRFTVTVVDPLLEPGELAEADRVLRELDFSRLGANSDRHVVVASRGSCDEEALEQALQSGSAYVALVANRKRGEEVLRGLQLKGVSQEKLATVRVPAGLQIGAEQPEEIALSILAEIVSLRKKEAKTQSSA
ncbi:MAG TPA: NTP transferase domain-containing protein [Terriglobales bacterium]|nr:NTP transferase domain-containing protein [Terriglobales bacterium]